MKNLCKVISQKNAMPIMANILCTVDEDGKRLTMTGSDTEIWLTYAITLDVCEGGGTFCVGANMIKDALAGLRDQSLTILATLESGRTLHLQHETGETVLPLEDSGEYPLSPSVEATATVWELDSDMLRRVLRRSLFATAEDELRPQMNGVYFDQLEGMLNIVASDGHVLILNTEKVVNTIGSFNMQKKAAKLLPDLLEGVVGNVRLMFDSRQVSCTCGTVSLVFRVIEGRFPNYNSVIPKVLPYKVMADRQAMLAALRNVSHFANFSSHMIVLDIIGQEMMIVGEDYDFSTKAHDRLRVEYPDGKNIRIGVKSDNIIDILSRLVETDVYLNLADPSRAMTVTPVEPVVKDEEITMLLMPMLLDNN